MKKANALSCASTFDRLKMPFTAATSGSASEVMNPQAKNNVVTEANAPVALLWVGMRLSTELASVIDLRSGGPGGAAGRVGGRFPQRARLGQDRKSTRLNPSPSCASPLPSSACKKKHHSTTNPTHHP